MPQTLSKAERICGRRAIETLMKKGKWGSAGLLRYCVAENGQENDRILISVPKKFFHRAVRRNLLKRRMRESFRTRKNILETADARHDILMIYNTGEIADMETVRDSVTEILKKIASR